MLRFSPLSVSMMHIKKLAAVMALLVIPQAARADQGESTAIVELGASGQWGLNGGSSYGPNLGVEITPIPEVLEVEADVTPYFSHGQTEWDSDFLLKKPFDLSESLEFMAGAGPEWEHTIRHGATTDAVGAEAALDFMYWPRRDRTWGLYLEPTYAYSFGRDHEQSLSVSIGLLLPIP
jgi:hypothetical protein